MPLAWPKTIRREPGCYVNPREFDDERVRGWVAKRWRYRRWRVRDGWHCLRIRRDSDEGDPMRTIAMVHTSLDFEALKKVMEDLCLARWGRP